MPSAEFDCIHFVLQRSCSLVANNVNSHFTTFQYMTIKMILFQLMNCVLYFTKSILCLYVENVFSLLFPVGWNDKFEYGQHIFRQLDQRIIYKMAKNRMMADRIWKCSAIQKKRKNSFKQILKTGQTLWDVRMVKSSSMSSNTCSSTSAPHKEPTGACHIYQ